MKYKKAYWFFLGLFMLNSNRNIKYVSYLFKKNADVLKASSLKSTKSRFFLFGPHEFELCKYLWFHLLRFWDIWESTTVQWQEILLVVHKKSENWNLALWIFTNIRSVNVLISGKVCFKAFFYFFIFLVFLILTSDRRYLVLLILVNYTLDSFHFALYSRHLSNKLARTHEENHVMKK